MRVSPHLEERHAALRPLEEMEVALVRSSLDAPGWLDERQEARIRYALNLARLTEVRSGDGRDIDLTDETAPFRERLTDALGPLLLDPSGVVERAEVAALVPIVWELATEYREKLRTNSRNRIAWDDVEREIREKALVLVCGGGGGSGYVFLGAFHGLEDAGLRPALLSGVSLGAILAAFRARSEEFDAASVVNIVQDLSWRKMFRAISIRSRYGLPGPLRLYLREGIGRHFTNDDGETPSIGDLEIPLLVTISGIRQGELPHDLEWYENTLAVGAPGGSLAIRRTKKMVTGLWRTLSDFASRPEIVKPLVIGADAATKDFDVLDAIGFSAAVPGLIHYDITREDPKMEALMDHLLEREQISRLLDGGIVDNVPARAAWRATANGMVGRRNALIVALDSFAPKLTSPLWIPIQRLARNNVRRNLQYAHVVMTFLRTLSPLDLVPSVNHLVGAVRHGRDEFNGVLPLVKRMMAPIDAVD